MNIGLRTFLVKNRLLLAVLLIALGIVIGIYATFWVSWIFFLAAIIMVAAHFLIGPITLIQYYLENGDFDTAKSLLEGIKFPGMLYKPVRSTYYMLKGNFSTMDDNLDSAEADIKKSLEAGIADKAYEGTAYLQLGSISYKKGNLREAYEHLRKSVQLGLPDNDSRASAFLQLCSICMQRRDFKACKQYFKKAKESKATNPQILDQLKEMEKYMSRIPG